MGGESKSSTSQASTTTTEYATNTLTQDLSGSEQSVLQGENAGYFSLENGVNVDGQGRIEVTDFGVLGKALNNVADLSRRGLDTVADLSRRSIEAGAEQLDEFLDHSTSLVDDVLMSSAGQLKQQAGAASEALRFATSRGENDLKGVFPLLVYGAVAIFGIFIFSRK